MDKITYSIISRGELKILFKGKSIRITGELVFSPPIFYADISSLKTKTELNDKEMNQIIEFLEKDSFKRIGTKIVFD